MARTALEIVTLAHMRAQLDIGSRQVGRLAAEIDDAADAMTFVDTEQYAGSPAPVVAGDRVRVGAEPIIFAAAPDAAAPHTWPILRGDVTAAHAAGAGIFSYSPDEQAEDERIVRAIEGAAIYVAKRTGRPIVTRGDTVDAVRPIDPDWPIALLGYDREENIEVVRVRYWTPAGSLRDVPDGEIPIGQLGRLASFSTEHKSLYPPAAGWPAVLDDSTIEILINTTTTNVAAGLEAAVILVARQLFEGYQEIRPTAAFHVLIEPFVRIRI